MANEIRIDLDPEGPITFVRPIGIPTPSGDAMKIDFTFLHRDADEMAALQEDWAERGRTALKADAVEKKARDAARKARIEAGDDPDTVALDEPLRVREHTIEKREADADAIMAVATDWGLKAPSGAKYEFTRENVVKFLKLYPGAAIKIITDYRVGLTEGRLGN